MSPEQAAGEGETDARSDLYSLAVVLYEMLAGEPPHTGPNASAVLAKIVSQHPAPLSTMRDVPERVDMAIARSLAKAPIDRFPSCAAFAEALLTGEVRISTPTSTSRVGTRKRMGIFAVSVLVAVVAGLLISQFGRSTDAARIAPVTSQITFTGGSEAVALAADGQMVAYLTDESRTLVVQDIRGGSEVRVVESETPIGRPRFSPDGATILFSGRQNGEFGLYTVSRLGGDPQLAVSIDLPFPQGTGGRGLRPPMSGAGPGPRAAFAGLFEAYDFAGSADRAALACCLSHLVSTPIPSRLRLSSPDSLSAPDEASVATLGERLERVLDLSVSPDGNWISILAQTRARETTLGIISAVGGELRTVATTDSISGLGAPLGAVRWPSPGQHVFYLQQAGQATNLLALPIDPRRGTSQGEPVLVRSGLPLDVSFDISLSTDRLVYTGGPQREHLVRVDIGAEPETPVVRRITQGTWHHHSPAISPNGEWVAYAKGTGTEWDVYRRSLIDGNEARITRAGLPITSLSWSPDGARLAVLGGPADPTLSVLDVATGRVMGVAAARPFPNTRPIWSPDGATVLFATAGDRRPPDQARARQIQRGMSWVAWEVETGVETRVDVGGARRVVSPVFSPDGRSIAVFGAFERNAGPPGLYILPLSTSEPRQLVDGSTLPLAWAEDGTIYLIRDNFRETGLTRIERMDAAQGGETVLHAVLPFECLPQDLTLAQDGRVAVCAVAETESDVWVTEHVNTGLR